MIRGWLRRSSHNLSSAGFLLVLCCFLLPFVTVSCEAPGGFGRAAPGGSTTYTGVDLSIGGAPQVTPADELRQPAERTADRLDPQLLAIAVLGLAAAGTVATFLIAEPGRRRTVAASLSTIAAVFLVANQATVEALLAVLVGNLRGLRADRRGRASVQTETVGRTAPM